MESQEGKVFLDAGYPLPGKIRQAQFVLPNVHRLERIET